MHDFIETHDLNNMEKIMHIPMIFAMLFSYTAEMTAVHFDGKGIKSIILL